MSFAGGLAQGLRPLVSHMAWDARTRDEREWREEQRERQRDEDRRREGLAADQKALAREASARADESREDFMGPPRPPMDGMPLGNRSRRSAAAPSEADVSGRLAEMYARHGFPDVASQMLGRSAQARTRADERDYRRGRDQIADQRYEDEFGLRKDERDYRRGRDQIADQRYEDEFGLRKEAAGRQARAHERQEQQWAREDEQRAAMDLYQAAQTGDGALMDRVVAQNSRFLNDYLGPGRRAVGAELVEGPGGEPNIALRVYNAGTDSIGPETMRASSDDDDEVVMYPLSYLASLAGAEPRQPGRERLAPPTRNDIKRHFLMDKGLSEDDIRFAELQEGGLEGLINRVASVGESIDWAARTYGYDLRTGEPIEGWQPDPDALLHPSERRSDQPSGQGTPDDPFDPQDEIQFNRIPTGAYFVNPTDGRVYRKN